MPPQSKVLQSPHVNQILDWIDENKSSRWISRELEKQYNENIGHGAISNFRKKNITAEALEIVNNQLKKESKENPKNEKIKSKVSEVVQNKAEKEIQINSLVEATAKQYRGVLNVADNFEADYYKLRDEAEDPQSKTSWKDVTDISFKAVKLAHEIHEGSSMEESITEGFGELADAIKKSREILKES